MSDFPQTTIPQDPNANSLDVFTVPQIAGILHIGRNSAYQLIREQRIRCKRIGRNILIPRSALVEFLNSDR